MVRSVHLSLAGLIVASGAAVGTGAASAQPAAPTSFVDAGLSAAFAALAPVEGGDDFRPAADPSVPDEGTPNPIRRASVLTFDLARAPEAGDLQVNPALGVDVLNDGSIEFGVNQQTATIVMVETDRPPTEAVNAVDNLSLAYNFPGQAVLEESPFANDPLIGFGTVLDRGSVQGQEFSSFQQVVDGQWQPYGDPIHTVGFSVEAPVQGFAPGGSSSRYVTASVLFGPAARIAWISSHAGSVIAEALYFAIVELSPPTVFLEPADVTTMEPLSSSIVREPVCGSDEVLDDGLCVPRCGEGTVLDGDVCVPIECADGEVLEGGVCTPAFDEFPEFECDRLGGSIESGWCTVTGPAEQPCGAAGGEVAGGVCLFADPLDETECGALGSDFVWDGDGCGAFVGDDAAAAAPLATDPPVADDDSPPVDDTTTATTDTGGGSFPWLPVGLGLLVLIVVGGFLAKLFWPFGGAPADGDGEVAGQGGGPPPEGPTPLPPMEPSEQACDWGVVYDDGTSRTRLKVPTGKSIGDYVVMIRTAVIDPPDAPTYGSELDQVARIQGAPKRIASDFGTLGLGHLATSWYYQYRRRWRSRNTLFPPALYTRMSDKILRRGDDPITSYLAFDDVDVRDGAVPMKTRSSLVERTRVEIEFVSTDDACGIERAHRFDMEGRSRSTVRLQPFCQLCSLTPIDELEEQVGETAAAALSSAENHLKWMDRMKCSAKLSGSANVQSSVRSNGTLNYEVEDRGTTQELDGTPGSYGVSATPKVKIQKVLEVKVYAEESKEHNQLKEKDEPRTGVGEREGTRVTVDLESNIHLEAELSTSDTTTEIDTSTSLNGTAASRHQLRIEAGCDPARMTCACPPPRLELRVGQPLRLGTSSNDEQEALMPGCPKGVSAEIRFEGTAVPIRRVDLTRWAIID